MNCLRRARPGLGTLVEIGVVGDGGAAQTAVEAAFAAIAYVERLLSFHNPHSELSRLNATPGVEQSLSPLSARVLGLALGLMRVSGGLFDCTVGGALVARGVLPDHAGPAALARGRVDDVAMNDGRALLRRPVRITLDGIAKGYAVDHAVAALRGHGASAGWVNAGGDMRVFGAMSLPVARRAHGGDLQSLGYLHQGAMATSTVTQQRDPRYPGHILAGSRGRRQCGTWTVFARHAWRADALTKVAALADSSERVALIARLGGTLLDGTPSTAT